MHPLHRANTARTLLSRSDRSSVATPNLTVAMPTPPTTASVPSRHFAPFFMLSLPFRRIPSSECGIT
jgi:hypothetical protein